MCYKDILVHLDNSSSLNGRLHAAAMLALSHQARLIGVFVSPRNNIPNYISAQIDSSLRTKIADGQNLEVGKIKTAFEVTLKNNNLSGQWVHENGDTLDVITTHARHADLLVLGQFNPEDNAIQYQQDMTDRLILASGRPVLVVPYIYKNAVFGQKIIIGWDGSRTATRAIHDALPILKTAKKTTVMCVKKNSNEILDDQPPGQNIAVHLSRHGVNAKAQHIISSEIKPATMLLNLAAEEGADMMVIGAYGHARIKELVMGGVTMHLLESMPLPVLFSH